MKEPPKQLVYHGKKCKSFPLTEKLGIIVCPRVSLTWAELSVQAELSIENRS